MAYKRMDSIRRNYDEMAELRWEASDIVGGTATGGTSIIIPAGVISVGYTVRRGAGNTFKIQATTDSLYTIENDPSNVIWADNPAGELTADYQGKLDPSASAIRLYSVSGATPSRIIISAK